MHQKLLKLFLSQEVQASENNIEKEPEKPRPKLNIYIYILYSIYIESFS